MVEKMGFEFLTHENKRLVGNKTKTKKERKIRIDGL
jgi:hypothetical protein